MEPTIFSDEDALKTVKPKSRPVYAKTWASFLDYNSSKKDELKNRMPNEKELCDYFVFLREEKKRASSSLWTIYSMLNAVIKGKYGRPLQEYPRLTALIKSLDTDVKQ